MPKSTMRRRRFVHLMALSAAAAAGTALSPGAKAAAQATAPSPTRRREAVPEPDRDRRTPAVRREIESQKKVLSASVRAVRDYPLAAGSAPAFVFRPHARDAGRSRGGREDR